MMGQLAEDKYKCCGCEACVHACPKHCIDFAEDEEGFRYPHVDQTICIDCGLCEKVCPVLNQPDPQMPRTIYAAQNTNEEELLKSSSGGLFVLFAKETIRNGGVVFGAKFNENWEVVHDYAETIEGIQSFIGSKYVQSRNSDTYAQTKDLLEQGRKVLYTGTSCQVAGLKNFLRKDYDNLLTIDVICHGVPSPKVWRRYINEIKESAHQDEKSEFPPLIHSISFRDKRNGWRKFSFTLSFAEVPGDSKKKSVSFSHPFNKDPYMQLFLRNLILRPSCYQCPAKDGRSKSDLTIADFWGIEKCLPEFDDDRGVGLLMINSEKGLLAAQSLSLKLHQVSFDDATAFNPVYTKSVVEPQKRQQCFRLLNSSNKPLSRIVETIFAPSLKVRIKQKLKNILK